MAKVKAICEIVRPGEVIAPGTVFSSKDDELETLMKFGAVQLLDDKDDEPAVDATAEKDAAAEKPAAVKKGAKGKQVAEKVAADENDGI